MSGPLQRFDASQRERPWLAFPIAVFKKFGDDRGGYLAALVAYYGFFSLFPLLLVLVTVLGFVVGNNPELQQKIVGSALSQFPVIGDQMRKNVHSIHGSGIALAIGIAGALWGGMGVIQALQNAMNAVWNVPVRKKPNFLKARIKAVVMLAVLGVATIVAAALSGIAAGGGSLSLVLKVLALAGSVAVNFGVFLVAFKVLTSEKVSWGDVAPGALVAAVAWGVLQTLGNYVVGHQLRNASQTYGAFALVIGLLSWLYLGAQVTILAAEINVVRARRLWPRSLQPPLGQAEKRALRDLAEQEERRPEERVEVKFDERADAHAGTDQPAEAEHADAGAMAAEEAPYRGPGGNTAAAAFGSGWETPEEAGRSAGAGTGSAGPQGAAAAGGSTWNGRPERGSSASEYADALREVARQAQALVRQELKLGKLEMSAKARSAGIGAGLFGAAGMVGVLAALVLVATIVFALATVLPGWAAGLVGAALVGIVAGILALRGRRAARQATPLAPEQAIGMLTSTKERVTQAWQAGTGAATSAPDHAPRRNEIPAEAPVAKPLGDEVRTPVPGEREQLGGEPLQGKHRGTDTEDREPAPSPEPAPQSSPPPPASGTYKLPQFPRF